MSNIRKGDNVVVITGSDKGKKGSVLKVFPKENRALVQGVVVSDKQEKTLVVKVERRFTHPLLKKTVRRSKNYHAHDENQQFKVGDQVSIEETKPISKLKRWTVLGAEAKA